MAAPGNGSLTFTSSDGNGLYAFNTMTTYSCNAGFSLVGSSNRTCTGDGSSTSGAFSGLVPTCRGTYNYYH